MVFNQSLELSAPLVRNISRNILAQRVDTWFEKQESALILSMLGAVSLGLRLFIILGVLSRARLKVTSGQLLLKN